MHETKCRHSGTKKTSPPPQIIKWYAPYDLLHKVIALSCDLSLLSCSHYIYSHVERLSAAMNIVAEPKDERTSTIIGCTWPGM